MTRLLAIVLFACTAAAGEFPPLDAPAADIAAALGTLRDPARITDLLRESSPLYTGRTPSEVARLRARLFVTLAAAGVPREALPLIEAELSLGHKPLPLAAAARAAAAAGPSASAALPDLVRLLSPAFHDEQLSLDEFEPSWPLRNPTSVRIEAVRALASFGDSASDALPALRELAANEEILHTSLGPKLAEELKIAMSALEPHCHSPLPAKRGEGQGEGPFLTPEHRSPTVFETTKPLALTFFYTRCDNDRKCSTTMSRFAQLQALANERGLAGKVRLVAVTYDPDYDTDYQLTRFATTRGLKVDDDTRLVRLPSPRLNELAKTLGLAVNFAGGRPNIHGVELFVLDRAGRVARAYRNVMWDEQQVLADLQRLAAE